MGCFSPGDFFGHKMLSVMWEDNLEVTLLSLVSNSNLTEDQDEPIRVLVEFIQIHAYLVKEL